MNSLPQSIEEALPSDNALEFGTVTALDPLRVNVRGRLDVMPGTLGGYVPNVGDPVAMLRQDATYLALGATASGLRSGGIAVTNAVATADTTASAAFTNIDGAQVFMVKRLANSIVRFDTSLTMFSTAVTTGVEMQVDVFDDDTSMFIARLSLFRTVISAANQHTPIGWSDLLSNLPATRLNFQLIWRRTSGAGTLTRDTDDWTSIIVQEVP